MGGRRRRNVEVKQGTNVGSVCAGNRITFVDEGEEQRLLIAVRGRLAQREEGDGRGAECKAVNTLKTCGRGESQEISYHMAERVLKLTASQGV